MLYTGAARLSYTLLHYCFLAFIGRARPESIRRCLLVSHSFISTLMHCPYDQLRAMLMLPFNRLPSMFFCTDYLHACPTLSGAVIVSMFIDVRFGISSRPGEWLAHSKHVLRSTIHGTSRESVGRRIGPVVMDRPFRSFRIYLHVDFAPAIQLGSVLLVPQGCLLAHFSWSMAEPHFQRSPLSVVHQLQAPLTLRSWHIVRDLPHP